MRTIYFLSFLVVFLILSCKTQRQVPLVKQIDNCGVELCCADSLFDGRQFTISGVTVENSNKLSDIDIISKELPVGNKFTYPIDFMKAGEKICGSKKEFKMIRIDIDKRIGENVFLRIKVEER